MNECSLALDTNPITIQLASLKMHLEMKLTFQGIKCKREVRSVQKSCYTDTNLWIAITCCNVSGATNEYIALF